LGIPFFFLPGDKKSPTEESAGEFKHEKNLVRFSKAAKAG